jgi:DNA-binding FadR family transcriptional regulator
VKDDPVEFNRRDAEFHMSLAQASHNPLLAVLLNSIHDLTESVRHLVQDYPRLGEVVLPDHIDIYDCVKAKDPVGARKMMLKHLGHARQIQKEYLASHKPSSS